MKSSYNYVPILAVIALYSNMLTINYYLINKTPVIMLQNKNYNINYNDTVSMETKQLFI